jgi:hypothetical protein
VLSLPIPALSVEQFDDFARFAQTPVAAQDWTGTFADAAQMAASVLYALGQPSVIAGTEERDALRHWLAFFGSENWRAESIRACKLPLTGPIEDHMSFSFGEPGRGFDEAAWSPVNHTVKHLNAWCQRALRDFYVAKRTAAPSDTGDKPSDEAMPADDAAGTATPQTKPAPAVRTEAEAEAEFLEQLKIERASGQVGTRQQHFDWAEDRGRVFTQARIRLWRSRHLTDAERVRKGRPDNPE